MMQELAIAACRLDAEAARRQAGRYQALAAHAEGVSRRPGTLVARFDAAVDPDLVATTLAIERECCPFFELGYDEAARRLEISVADRDLEPALDALAAAFRA
jgi:hypothetical protein